MVVSWCGLPLAVEALVVWSMIWDRPNHVAASSNVVSALWLFLLPLEVEPISTRPGLFSTTTLLDGHFALMQNGILDQGLPAMSAPFDTHAKGGRHALLVATHGAFWVNK
jgi:hypothetical protein